MRIALLLFTLFLSSCADEPNREMEARDAKNRAEVARQMGISVEELNANLDAVRPEEPTLEERHRASVEEDRRYEANCKADPGSIYC